MFLVEFPDHQAAASKSKSGVSRSHPRRAGHCAHGWGARGIMMGAMTIERRLFLISAVAMPLYAGPLVTFSDAEAKLVAAMTDLIIPADDTPGALAAGVVFYIDRQLAGPLRRYRGAYRDGLMKWAEFSTSDEAFLGSSFFQMVVDHTMQGFYGAPSHGGNAGAVSWKMLGIEDVMGHSH